MTSDAKCWGMLEEGNYPDPGVTPDTNTSVE